MCDFFFGYRVINGIMFEDIETGVLSKIMLV